MTITWPIALLFSLIVGGAVSVMADLAATADRGED